MDIAVLGIDLGKTVCSLAGVDRTGAVVLRKRVQRFRLLDFLAQLAPSVVAMEACGGAHHVGRFCLQFGHEPRLMSPLHVRPYVKVHKNDDRDAEGIAEAATRPTMSFVPIKTEEKLDLQALHRARERLVQDRTRLINQARLPEFGLSDGAGRSSCAGAACVPEIPDKARRRSQWRSDPADAGDAGGHGCRVDRDQRKGRCTG